MTQDLPIDCAKTHKMLESLTAEERIKWAVATFSDDVVLLSSMQRTSVVLMHMVHTLGLPNEFLFLDTGYHFTETLQMRDEYMRRFRMNIVTLYPELTIEEQETHYGKKLFSSADGQPECCRLRKEVPLLRHLATKKCPVTINGLRRAEGGKRVDILAITPIRARAVTDSRPSSTGLPTTCKPTSPSTRYPFTRCIRSSTRASDAIPAPRRSRLEKTRVRVDGGTCVHPRSRRSRSTAESTSPTAAASSDPFVRN